MDLSVTSVSLYGVCVQGVFAGLGSRVGPVSGHGSQTGTVAQRVQRHVTAGLGSRVGYELSAYVDSCREVERALVTE